MRSRSALPLTLPLVLSACAWQSYEPRPLDPARNLAALGARSLGDPELCAFARANLEPPAEFPPEVWGLEELVLVALFQRPELDVARAEAQQSEAAIRSAGARPNPRLGLHPEVVPNTAHPWILGLQLDLPLETAGKRGLRVRAAEEQAEVARLRLGLAAWEVRASVRAALAELEAARTQRALLAEQEEVQRERTATLRALRDAGQISSLELARGDQELARLRSAREHAEGRSELAWAGLAQALAMPDASLESLRLAPLRSEPWPRAEDGRRLRALGLQNRLDLQGELRTHAQREQELQLEIARQQPDLELAPGFSWDQGDAKFALGFAFELPVFHRNEGPIAEAEARRQASAARFAALQEEIIAAVEGARVRYEGLLRECEAAASELALARQQEQRVRATLEAGTGTRLELLDARLSCAALAQALAAREDEAMQALGALEDQLQCPLTCAAEAP